MFTERRDVKMTNEYSHLTDAELAQKLVEVGQLMLADDVIEHDEVGLIGRSPSVPPEPRSRSR